jgi:amino acid adenylation domain-containing protein
MNMNPIINLIQQQASATPENIAVVYNQVNYTYRDVMAQASGIAQQVSQAGLVQEDVVGILIPRSQWLAIAPLGVLAAGCAYMPLDPAYPAERLNFMLSDSRAKLLIADREVLAESGLTVNDGVVEVENIQVPIRYTDELTVAESSVYDSREVDAKALALLIYTSGSTGQPKGCMIEQGNISYNAEETKVTMGLDSNSRVASYASFSFVPTVHDIFGTLSTGGTLYIIPEDIRFDFVRLSQFINDNAITHIIMSTMTGRQFVTLYDCPSLRFLSVGGEKLEPVTPTAGLTFLNIYGSSECCGMITCHAVKGDETNVPIGQAPGTYRLYIVGEDGQQVADGEAGELWVSGPQLCRGYLNHPDLTANVFIENPFNTTHEEGYERVFRTGDFVRRDAEGNLLFAGRRDGLVKIRGFRVELREVEAAVLTCPDVKEATLQSASDTLNGTYIVAYVTGDGELDAEAIKQHVAALKPEYMVPEVVMQIDEIPRNNNGKVDRERLPKPVRSAPRLSSDDMQQPENDLQRELHQIIAKEIGTEDFGINTPLLYVGLTSVSAIKLAVQVNKHYGVTLDSRALVKSATLKSIEQEILTQGAVTPTTIERDHEGICPLSYAQTGVYFECLKNPLSTIYNTACLLSYPAGIEAEKLADVVKQVVEAHPELSVHFTTQGDVIIQTLEDSVAVEVPVTEMSDEALTAYKQEYVRPFNIQRAPLYRFEVVKTESGVHLLMDVHHLVFDGGSADLLIRQINSVLNGSPIEKETYTYFDFVADQQKAEDSDTFRASQQFFAEKLQTCEGASEIPADLPKTDRQGVIGEAVCPIPFEALGRQLSTLNSQLSTFITPAHLLLAATSYVVSRYTNNREVYLCTVSSGRSNLKIAETVGMFVNTLPLSINVSDVTVSDFLRQTSENIDETLSHEDYPFARIAADFDFRPAIAYAYQVGVLSQYSVGGKPVSQDLLDLNVPMFKINIKIEDRGVVVEYDDTLYSDRLGQALAESIVAVAERMMAQPQMKVRQLSIVSKNQEEELLHLRQTATGDAPFKFFHDCISHFAQAQPEHEALVAIDAQYTYKEMDEVTNRIANGLRQRGVKECDRVALLLPRTSRLILSLFGVLKAGAAYIPCDPEYPADRIKLILEDSEARYIITTSDRMDSVPADKAIDVEELLSSENCGAVETAITPDDLAYLIYTSGSTGRPKGVMLRHEGICNYLYGHPANVFANAVLTDAKRMLSVTTISFDAALQDIGMCYYNGKTLILATEEQANNPLDLAHLINEQQINMVSGTPSRWQTWLTSPDFCEAIAKVSICRAGGEKFSDQLLTLMRSVTKARIFNCYGPTEITVASNNAELTNAELVTVGKPQLNVKEFIVDADGNELPSGVVGELYIGGRGVARGYNNLDEMTRERFVEYHGERIYKSGDYAKWLPDGNIIILGRTDHQIKLRGLRIELGEIENVMLKVEGIKKVVILIRKLNDKEHLCAYYTADREIAPDALKAEISKSLTQYMVPTAYLQLSEMPMTPNGKTDVKALPEPQLAISSAYEEPANDTERTFCDIFAGILQMDRVGATDNFFELGGTSLVVTRVIIEADKAGMHVAYGDVFANPTPRQLATLITGETSTGGSATEADPVADYDYTAIDNLLQRNTLNAFRAGNRLPLGNVLLTGATGYLGIHILRELIDSDAENIYCLVRGKTLEKAESRLRTLLFYYFANSFKELFGTRLHVILGDVTEDLCAVVSNAVSINTVFNCAAIVKHFSEGTEIEDVNIGGAQRCVDFCVKHGATLVHVSTASTRGLWVGDSVEALSGKLPTVFTEQRLYMGQYLGNKYIYSKFMAERLILDAVAKHGLTAKIMRVGNLAARSTDGEFQANFSTNSFMGRIRIYNMLGCCPYEMCNTGVEFSPINEVSRAIVLLATTPKECTVFHPYNIHAQFLGDVLSGLTSVGQSIRFVEQEDFHKAMDEAGQDPQKAKQMAALLAYKDVAHGQKTSDVKRDNNYTTQVLYRLDFRWSPTSWDYVERMLTAIGGFGFFEE